MEPQSLESFCLVHSKWKLPCRTLIDSMCKKITTLSTLNEGQRYRRRINAYNFQWRTIQIIHNCQYNYKGQQKAIIAIEAIYYVAIAEYSIALHDTAYIIWSIHLPILKRGEVLTVRTCTLKVGKVKKLLFDLSFWLQKCIITFILIYWVFLFVCLHDA